MRAAGPPRWLPVSPVLGHGPGWLPGLLFGFAGVRALLTGLAAGLLADLLAGLHFAISQMLLFSSLVLLRCPRRNVGNSFNNFELTFTS